MRCSKHGIVAGPDGQCVVCRRESTPAASSRSNRLIYLVVGGFVLVTTALVLARSFGARKSSAVSVVPVASSIVAEAPAPRPAPTPAPTPTPVAEPWPAATQRRLPDSAVPAAVVSAVPELAASASAPAGSASALAASPSPSASQARPSEAALASAIRATPIIMFSTGWCGVCTRARAFLSANGLSYVERDIDHDPNARDELKRRTGKSSIPTIEVDGQLLTPGFSEQAIMAAVASSVKRRLGVDGVVIRPRT